MGLSTNSNLSGDLITTTTEQEPHCNSPRVFFSSIGKQQSRIIEDTTLSITNELSIYRSLALQEYNDIVEHSKEHDPFRFWNLHSSKMKFLSTLVRKLLIVPITSVPSEFTFSAPSCLGRKEQSRLTPENLCMLVFLKDKVNDDE